MVRKLHSNFRVSCIIPAYNRAQTIKYCLDSVIGQTFQAYDIIVIDDCSTDNTAEIVNRHFAGIRYIQMDKHSGAQAARNRGIREATGNWIAFHDSDDEWHTEKLEKQVRILESVDFDPMTVVHTDCWRYDAVTGAKTLWELLLIDGPTVLPKLLNSSGPMFQGMLTSKAALESIGLLDEKVPSYQEWDTAIRLAKICRFMHLREPLFTYYLHEGDTISKDMQRDIDGYQYIVDKFRDDIITFCGIEVYNSHLLNNAFKAVRWGFREKAIGILRGGQTNGMKVLGFLCRKGADERSISLASHALKRFYLL